MTEPATQPNPSADPRMRSLDAVIEAIADLTLVEADAVLEAARLELMLIAGPTSHGSGKALVAAYRVDRAERAAMEAVDAG